MTPAKLDVLIATFAYSSNGGYRSAAVELIPWFAPLYHRMCGDERIGAIILMQPGDVPLTMERNKVVL